MMPRSHRWSWAVFLLLGSVAPSLHAQSSSPEDFSIASQIAAGAEQAAGAIAQGRIETANFSKRLEEARAKFWETWPDEPGHREASAELASLLWQKDFLYLIAFSAEGPPRPGDFDRTSAFSDVLRGRLGGLPPDLKLGQLAFTTIMGRIDEGIPSHLQGLFYDWVNDVRRGLGARGPNDLLLVNPLRIVGALSAAQPAYLAYARERDRHEYYTGPHSPLGSEDPREFLTAALARGRRWSPAMASEQVALLERFAGPGVLEHAARSIVLPGEDPRTVNAESYSHRIALGLFSRLREFNPPTAKGWLAVTYMPSDFGELPKAMQEIETLYAAHGRERVLEAADRLRRIGQRHARGGENSKQVRQVCSLSPQHWGEGL